MEPTGSGERVMIVVTGASGLLGALLVTAIQLAAMSRADTPESDRRDFLSCGHKAPLRLGRLLRDALR